MISIIILCCLSVWRWLAAVLSKNSLFLFLQYTIPSHYVVHPFISLLSSCYFSVSFSLKNVFCYYIVCFIIVLCFLIWLKHFKCLVFMFFLISCFWNWNCHAYFSAHEIHLLLLYFKSLNFLFCSLFSRQWFYTVKRGVECDQAFHD